MAFADSGTIYKTEYSTDAALATKIPWPDTTVGASGGITSQAKTTNDSLSNVAVLATKIPWADTTVGTSGGITSQAKTTNDSLANVAALATKLPIINVMSYGAKGDSATNDSASIESALIACHNAGGGIVYFPVTAKKTYLTGGNLVVYSNTTVQLDPNVVVQFTTPPTTGFLGPLLVNYSVVSTPRTLTDAAITHGTFTMTSATGAFSHADSAKSIYIAGANAQGTLLCTTIAGIVSSTSVTLADSAQATVTGATAKLYVRDSNIVVTGGTWDRKLTTGGSATYVGKHTLVFRRVDKLSINGATVNVLTQGSSAVKYAINIGDCTKVNVQNITFNTGSDGLHFNGPDKDLVARHMRGTTHDDFVAYTSVDYSTYSDVLGNIDGILEEDVRGTTLGSLAHLFGGAGGWIHNGKFQNLTGVSAGQVFYISDDSIGHPRNVLGGLEADGISVDGVFGTTTSQAVELEATLIKHVSLRDIETHPVSGYAMVDIVNGANTVAVNGLYDLYDSLAYTAADPPRLIRVTGTMGTLAISNVQGEFYTKPAHPMDIEATINALSMSHVYLTYDVTPAVSIYAFGPGIIKHWHASDVIMTYKQGYKASIGFDFYADTVVNFTGSQLTFLYGDTTGNAFNWAGSNTLMNTFSVTGLSVDHYTGLAYDQAIFNIASGDSISVMQINNANIHLLALSSADAIANQGKINQLSIANWNQLNGGYLIHSYGTGNILWNADLSNIYLKSTYRLGGFYNNTVDLTLSNAMFDSLQAEAIYLNTSTLTLRGSGIHQSFSRGNIKRYGSEVVHAINLDYPCDVAQLTQTSGDRAYNTNTALVCGTGPVISNGTTWNPLHPVAGQSQFSGAGTDTVRVAIANLTTGSTTLSVTATWMTGGLSVPINATVTEAGYVTFSATGAGAANAKFSYVVSSF
jgi:hypothetical protein